MIPNSPQFKALRDRIYNWKFNSAHRIAIELPDDLGNDKSIIKSLASLFGNSGWIEGDIGTLAACAVHCLIGNEND